jgi:glutaredoxin
MNPHQLLLFFRAECCLCEEMKNAIEQVAAKIPVQLKEVDVDSSADLRERFGSEVPVLFIDGRKAFKFGVTARQLERRLGRAPLWRRLARAGGGAPWRKS